MFPVNGRTVRYDKTDYNSDMLTGCKFRVYCEDEESEHSSKFFKAPTLADAEEFAETAKK